MVSWFCLGQGQLNAASLFVKYSHKKVLLFTSGMMLMAQLAFSVSVEVVRGFFFLSSPKKTLWKKCEKSFVENDFLFK